MAAMGRIRCLLCCLLACVAIDARAAESVPPSTDARTRTVIIGLAARRGIEDQHLAAALSDVVQTAYARDGSRVVIGRDEIKRVLSWEADRQAAGCDDSGCLAEIGAALDAARIVTGSVDRIGGGWLVVITEVDAKTADPVGRVQDQSAGDEAALVALVARLAEQLVQQAATNAGGGGFAQAGSIDVVSNPRGADVFVAGKLMGKAPLRVDNLRTGTQAVRMIRDDYDPIEVQVPVYPGGTTLVSAEMRINRALAEQNYEMRKTRVDDEQGWKTARVWTGFGTGCAAMGAGGALGLLSASQGGALLGVNLASVACGGVGLGLLGWGVIELLTPLKPPIPEWEEPRKVVVTPPDGKGVAMVRELNLQPATAY